jgi:hypothetical protein
MTPDARGGRTVVSAGLCESCGFAEVITSSKGSVFYRCRLADSDPTFPRYPALPVLACRGYRRIEVALERDR